MLYLLRLALYSPDVRYGGAGTQPTRTMHPAQRWGLQGAPPCSKTSVGGSEGWARTSSTGERGKLMPCLPCPCFGVPQGPLQPCSSRNSWGVQGGEWETGTLRGRAEEEQGGRRSDEADNSSVRLMDGQTDSQTAGVGLAGLTEGQRGLRKQRDSWLLKGWGARLEGWLGR